MEAIERGAASLAHFRSQAPPVQESEQEPVQITWQVEALQVTLLEAPTVKLQVEPPAQPRLAEVPAVSVQLLPPVHPPLQEAPQESAPQVPLTHAMLQLTSEVVQDALVHPLPPPQASAASQVIATIHFTFGLAFRVPRGTRLPELAMDHIGTGRGRAAS